MLLTGAFIVLGALAIGFSGFARQARIPLFDHPSGAE
jgi:hypothetical protein